MTSLRLLRFAGLMFLLGSVASASAQTVAERMKKDPNFRIYPATFGVTATSNSTPPVIRAQQVGTPRNERTKSGHPPKIDIPDAWIEGKAVGSDLNSESISRAGYLTFPTGKN